MKYDVIIVGAGPAGIFTAVELRKQGYSGEILLIEKGAAIWGHSGREAHVAKRTFAFKFKAYINGCGSR